MNVLLCYKHSQSESEFASNFYFSFIKSGAEKNFNLVVVVPDDDYEEAKKIFIKSSFIKESEIPYLENLRSYAKQMYIKLWFALVVDEPYLIVDSDVIFKQGNLSDYFDNNGKAFFAYNPEACWYHSEWYKRSAKIINFSGNFTDPLYGMTPQIFFPVIIKRIFNSPEALKELIDIYESYVINKKIIPVDLESYEHDSLYKININIALASEHHAWTEYGIYWSSLLQSKLNLYSDKKSLCSAKYLAPRNGFIPGLEMPKISEKEFDEDVHALNLFNRDSPLVLIQSTSGVDPRWIKKYI